MSILTDLLAEILDEASVTNHFYRNQTYQLDKDNCPTKAAISFVKSRLKELEGEAK